MTDHHGYRETRVQKKMKIRNKSHQFSVLGVKFSNVQNLLNQYPQIVGPLPLKGGDTNGLSLKSLPNISDAA